MNEEIERLKKRLAQLEERVGRLEAGAPESKKADVTDSPGKTDPTSLIRVIVINKRHQPPNIDLGQYQDHIWFDCSYHPEGIARITRAVKGVLEFADLFGEVKFRIGLTLNEPLSPDQVFTQKGIGFEYNQFMSDHQWMLGTNIDDMKITFRVNKILYVDGTEEIFT